MLPAAVATCFMFALGLSLSARFTTSVRVYIFPCAVVWYVMLCKYILTTAQISTDMFYSASIKIRISIRATAIGANANVSISDCFCASACSYACICGCCRALASALAPTDTNMNARQADTAVEPHANTLTVVYIAGVRGTDVCVCVTCAS